MLRIKKPITFTAAFLVASFVLYVSAQPLGQEDAMPFSAKGKQHELLAKDAGNWDAKCTWNGPGGPSEFEGKETISVDCGGLWVFSTFEADFMGMPFKGRSVTGYDPEAKKFVGAWVDSMTPHMVHLEGAMEGDALVMMTEGRDPETGETFPEKHVQRHEGPDKRIFEMFALRDGGEHLMMKIVYTRKK